MAAALGFEWLKQRVDSLPDHLRSQLLSPLPDLPRDLKEQGVIATGVGSSEAAARYFVHLLNRIGIAAEFVPFSAFYIKVRLPAEKTPYLAVFSQGLSPNASIVLKQRALFSGTLLFTSSMAEGQRAAGKIVRAALLEELATEGASILLHPLQNEYQILPRLVGPLCVMFAVCLVIEKLEPGSLGGNEQLASVPDVVSGISLSETETSGLIADLQSGLHFWFTHAGSQYAQNLSCKLFETLFISPPPWGDILTYSHGPFQLQMKAPPAPNWIFTTADKNEQALLQTLRPLFDRAGGYKEIQSPLPAHLAIFYYEAYLNTLLLSVMANSDLDLVNWPGKGQDDEGYRIDSPGAFPANS